MIVPGHFRLCHHLIGIGHAEIDDASELSCLHAGRDGLPEVKNRMEVAVEHFRQPAAVSSKRFTRWYGSAPLMRGIDASPLGFDVRDQPLCGLRIRHVALTAKADHHELQLPHWSPVRRRMVR